jgi:hypothetical protein
MGCRRANPSLARAVRSDPCRHPSRCVRRPATHRISPMRLKSAGRVVDALTTVFPFGSVRPPLRKAHSPASRGGGRSTPFHRTQPGRTTPSGSMSATDGGRQPAIRERRRRAEPSGLHGRQRRFRGPRCAASAWDPTVDGRPACSCAASRGLVAAGEIDGVRRLPPLERVGECDNLGGHSREHRAQDV